MFDQQRKIYWKSKFVWPSSKHKNVNSTSLRLTVFSEKRVGKSLEFLAQSSSMTTGSVFAIESAWRVGGLYAPTSPRVNCGDTTHSEIFDFGP